MKREKKNENYLNEKNQMGKNHKNGKNNQVLKTSPRWDFLTSTRLIFVICLSLPNNLDETRP